jgi:hypothetical protein
MIPTSRRTLAIALATAVAAGASTACIAPAAEQGSGKVVVFNLTESPLFKPKNFYLSANAGPQLAQLRWERWGKSTTTATGIYISDCPSCGPEERRPAIVRFSGLKACPKYDGRTYKSGTLTVIADDGTKRTSALSPSSSFHCK